MSWRLLFNLGHSFFRDETGRIGVRDDSGDNPDNAEDGTLYVDLNEPIKIGSMATVAVTDRKGAKSAIIESAEGGLLLAERLCMSVNAGGRVFKLVEIIKVAPRPTVLLAGSDIGGENTELHRVVLLRWPDGEFSVHTQHWEGKWSLHNFTGGDYCGGNLEKAWAAYRHRADHPKPNETMDQLLQQQLNTLTLCLLAQIVEHTGRDVSLIKLIKSAMSPQNDAKRRLL